MFELAKAIRNTRQHTCIRKLIIGMQKAHHISAGPLNTFVQRIIDSMIRFTHQHSNPAPYSDSKPPECRQSTPPSMTTSSYSTSVCASTESSAAAMVSQLLKTTVMTEIFTIRPSRYVPRLTIQSPSTSTSIFVRRKQSSASRGLHTTGSFSLKDVFNTIGTPVISRNVSIRCQ